MAIKQRFFEPDFRHDFRDEFDSFGVIGPFRSDQVSAIRLLAVEVVSDLVGVHDVFGYRHNQWGSPIFGARKKKAQPFVFGPGVRRMRVL